MKPLLCFDIEGTGPDPAVDRIVQFGAVYVRDEGNLYGNYLFNPGVTMSDEVIAVHGITNERVAAAEPFKAHCFKIFEVVSQCDLIGFNLLHYDIPILWEEFYRCGIEWDLKDTNVIDVFRIFQEMNPRNLKAAVLKYLGIDFEGHDAADDSNATLEVFYAQLTHGAIVGKTREELAKFCARDDNRMDLAGKIILIDGEPTYNIGKAKGVRVRDDIGFGRWMLDKDFSEQTKMVLRKILDELSAKKSR